MPITEHPDARRQRRLQRHDGQDPRHRHRHRRPLRLELRRDLQGRLGHLDPGGRRATRPRRPRTRCSSPASAATPSTRRRDRLGHHDHRPGRDQVRPGRHRPGGRRQHRQPGGAGGRPRERRDDQLDRQRAARAGRRSTARRPRPRASTAPYYRSLQGMRVQLPEGIATGGGTTKFRDVFLEPGTTRAAAVPQERRGGRDDAVVTTRRPRSASRPTAAPATRPTRACRGAARRRSTSTCSTSPATSSAR